MAHERTIHPRFWKSEDILPLPAEARLLFIGIWAEADRNGVFEWRPNSLCAQVLPGLKVQPNELLLVLASHGLIKRFEFDGQAFGFIKRFSKYQIRIHPEESTKYPEPMEDVDYTANPPKWKTARMKQREARTSTSPTTTRATTNPTTSVATTSSSIEPATSTTSTNKSKPPYIPPSESPLATSTGSSIPATPLSKNSNGHKPDLWQNIWETCRKIVPVEAMGEFGLGDLDHWFRRGTQVSFEGGLLRVNTDHDTVTEHRGLGKYAQWIREARSKFGVAKIEFLLDGQVKEIRLKPRPI